MAKARKPKNDEAPGAKPSENTGAKVLHQKLCLSIDFKKRKIYGYTELEVSVPDIGIVGLHAENLGIESVLVDGEPTVFEYYPRYQNSEPESNFNSVSDPASAADTAALEYVRVLKREEDTLNLLINCCKPSKDLSEQLDNVALENGSQSSGEAKQNVKLIRINYWIEKTESGIHFDENIVHTDNQMRRARCWFPCRDDEYHRCSFNLEFTVPHNFVAASVGKLLYQVMSKEDITQKTYVYELAIPIAPRWVSLVAGPLEVLPDQTNFVISNLCLPHDLSRLRNTMEFFHEAYSYYEDYLSAKFPFGFYKQVFLPPEIVVCSSTLGASMSVFSSHMLYDERVIDQIIDTRIKLASALAKQWFGVYIVPESPNDDWLLDGLAGFLTDMFIKQFLGNNEARYRRYKANSAVCKADDSGAMCLSASSSCKDLFGTHSIGMHGKIRSWKSGAVLQMLEKQMGSESFRKILQKIISRAKDPSNATRSLSTKEFRQFSNKIGNLERPFLKEFFQRWVASCGCPVLRIGLSYNKRKNIVEMAALRECTASLDSRLSVGATSDSENRDVDVGWPGIMSIRVYELDGMSDHPKLPMAGDRWQLLELPCHSKLAAKRYQKPKKGGKPDGADDNVDAIAPLDNKTSIESPLAWIKADPEMEYIAEVHLHQPLQMWVNQLEKDGDVVGQAQAIASLEALKQHSFSVVNALNNILTDSKVFWRIRIGAAFALAKSASEETDWAGLQHLIKFYKSRRFDAEIGLPKPNDFRDFPEYFVLEAIPHTIAKVRGGDGKSPREAVEFILQLLKYNDNSGNPYSDVFWLAVLVQSIGDLEFGQQTLTFLAPLLKRIDRLLQFDRLMPSYSGVLTISCIRTLAQTALKLSDSISFEYICKLLEPFRKPETILQVRIEASRALLDIEYESKGISSTLSLFMKYVIEESSLRGQVKLCVHTMRLCQIAVGFNSDDCVDTVSLLDLLHLFKNHVVFHNEFLRHHLFCIFQILAGRPPTLFGVPKERPLQLVDVEACIEPQNVFSVPGAEPGEPSLLPLGDANGNSLDVAPLGVPVRSQEMFMPTAPEMKPVAASLHDAEHIEPHMENQNQPLPENPIVHEIPSDGEAPTEELAKAEENLPTTEPQKEPDVVPVSVSHEVKTVIRIKVRPSGATSRAEGSARTVERSQGIVVRRDIERRQTSSASVDAPQRISADAHMEEVNSCHDVGSRMTASIGSVKLVNEGDTSGKELQCTAESGKTSTSQKADDNNQEVAAVPNLLPQDSNTGNEAQQKYGSLQTLSVGKESEKKKDKEHKKEKKRKREDPVYLEKKRLKKEKKQKEKEMSKLLSSASDPATKKIETVPEAKPEGPKAEASAAPAEARPSTKIRIKLKSKAFNNS